MLLIFLAILKFCTIQRLYYYLTQMYHLYLSAGFGEFTLEFLMYTNLRYASKVTSFPATIEVGSRIYFQAKVDTVDSNISLLIEQCFASPVLSLNHSLKYQLIAKR